MHMYSLRDSNYNFRIPAKAALDIQLNNHNHPSALSRNGKR
jgi:hypothetical protein